ncbi:hypothetical protein AB5I39_13850 [Sphingomonas sp. MMS24-J45]|uniref:hypothetical protein n=1 Tax=Sphingomonas sp. MMS24-J45 TaxID=3238806 RepID=UPI00384ACAAF
MKDVYKAEVPSLPPRPGSRLVSRLVGELLLAGPGDVVAALEDHLGHRVPRDRAIFLLLILRESGRLTGASVLSGGVSISAVARSLDRPFETVRRHVNALIGDGICETSRNGVIVSAATWDLPPFLALTQLLHDRFVAMIADLAHSGIALPDSRAGVRHDPDAIVAAAIDIILAPFEYVASQFRSWLEMMVVCAVTTGSVRQVTYDPILTRRYADADTIPPDQIREPVVIAGVARALRLHYATVRREVQAAIACGTLMRAGAGVRATEAYLSDVTISRGGMLVAARTAQVLQRLACAGFRLEDPASYYLVGKPALPAFD